MDDEAEGQRGGGQERRRREGACVVVTGAAGGIGLAVVERLHRDGWRVVAADLDDAVLAPLAARFAGDDRVTPCAMDVSAPASIAAAAASLRGAGVAVAGLVNVAGILQDVVPLMSMDEAAIRRVWEVNYFGAQACLRTFAAMMVENGGGAVVNITSVNERRPLPLPAYAPAKVALGGLTQVAAGELGPLGVRVNAVAPGFTLTPTLRGKIASGKRDASVIEAHTPLGRLVETNEIAAAVAFLLGDDASAITGASLPVDGGWLVASHWMNFRALSAS